MPLPVFISWSGKYSQSAAAILKEWIPEVLQTVETFVSENITAGSRWNNEIAAQLEKSGYGILCLTPENLTAPWILYEAGALSKMVASSFVAPVLIGVERSQVHFPLQHFQSVTTDREEIKKLFKSINEKSDNPIDDVRFSRIFDRSFPEYHQKLEALVLEINSNTTPEKKQITSDFNDHRALDDLLKVMQSVQVVISNPENLLPRKYIENVFGSIGRRQRIDFGDLPSNHPAWRDLESSVLEIHRTLNKISGENLNQEDAVLIGRARKLSYEIGFVYSFILRKSTGREFVLPISRSVQHNTRISQDIEGESSLE